MGDTDFTLFDRAVRWCKNQPVIVVLIILVVAVGLIATFAKDIGFLWPRLENSATPVASSTVENLLIFVEGGLLPTGFTIVQPGSRMSLAKISYPAGEFGHIHGEPYFEVEIEGGPFSRVLYYYSGSDADSDPKIQYIVFLLRRGSASGTVSKAALEHFGTENAEIFVDGRITWSNLGGTKVEFRPTRNLEYSISR